MYRLSKAQQAVYSMETFGGSELSVNCARILITGTCNEDALIQSVRHMYKINDALRTSIHFTGGELKQRVDPYTE